MRVLRDMRVRSSPSLIYMGIRMIEEIGCKRAKWSIPIPVTGHACMWVGQYHIPNVAHFWENSMPDTESTVEIFHLHNNLNCLNAHMHE